MEVIKNYLESMFANLPNTPEVLRAKQELLQMMEDKYSELIAEGKRENDAVAIVISEFGNLDELMETLHLTPIIDEYTAPETRHVTFDEANAYINAEAKRSFLVGLGVMLCIMCVIPPMLADGLFRGSDFADAIGVCLMFIMIGMAVAIFIIARTEMKVWDFLKNSPCSIDYSTGEFVYAERQRNVTSRVLQLTIGIILCILCVIPVILFDGMDSFLHLGSMITDSVAPSMMFVIIAIGVLLIICSTGKEKAFHTLLSLNDRATVAGNYESVRGDIKYENETLESFMSIYWKAILCLYLIWSFTTFKFGTTWVIWPIAGIARHIIDKNFGFNGGLRK